MQKIKKCILTKESSLPKRMCKWIQKQFYSIVVGKLLKYIVMFVGEASSLTLE